MALAKIVWGAFLILLFLVWLPCAIYDEVIGFEPKTKAKRNPRG